MTDLCTLCRREEVLPGGKYCWLCDGGGINPMLDDWANENLSRYVAINGDTVTVTHEDSRGIVTYHTFTRVGGRLVRAP